MLIDMYNMSPCDGQVDGSTDGRPAALRFPALVVRTMARCCRIVYALFMVWVSSLDEATRFLLTRACQKQRSFKRIHEKSRCGCVKCMGSCRLC